MASEFHDALDDKFATEDDINGQFKHDSDLRSLIDKRDDEISWFRNDVPSKQIPIPPNPLLESDDCELGLVSRCVS